MGSRNGHPEPLPPGAAPQFSRSVPTPIRKDIDSLTERVKQLEREKAALESFAAIAAHEMIEPLVITEAYAAMLAERLDPADAESGQAVDMVFRSAARARLLVETLLHDARAADRQLQLEDVDLERTVTDCLELLAPDVKARGARIVVGEMPQVRGEAVMLGSVMGELLVK